MAGWRKAPDTITHEGRTLTYELVRRPRVTRNLYLELAENGGLRVVAPRRMSGRAVQRSLQGRSGEVVRFLGRARADRRALPDFSYANGERHLFLGRECTLSLQPPGAPVEPFDGERIVLGVRATDGDSVREALRRWYRARAAEQFPERLDSYCKRAPWTGGNIAPLRLRRMKRTMGSCSRSGVITLNPHLVKAPPDLVDYVVAHEVCHLAEHNHGKRFYTLLDSLYPGWRAAQARLRAGWRRYRAE